MLNNRNNNSGQTTSNNQKRTITEKICREFGNKLRFERDNQKLSQEQLADMAGVSVDSIRRYENHVTNARLDIAYLLARALNVPLDSLLPERPMQNKEIMENPDVKCAINELIGKVLEAHKN